MREITLNGKYMTSIPSLHKYLQAELILPEGRGQNLDDLWDCLMTIDFPTHIALVRASAMLDEIYEYGEELVQLFYDICIANKNITFSMSQE